jgi:hypothetical protein
LTSAYVADPAEACDCEKEKGFVPSLAKAATQRIPRI